MTDTKEKYHVVSFSGGKDSTCMLLMMLEKGMQVDEILFCDTGMEFPEMYEHLKKVEEYTGREITVIKEPRTFEYWLNQRVLTKGKRKGHIGYGWPTMRNRWCTSRLKTDVIAQHLRELRKRYEIAQYIGITADETERVKDMNYPLVEWGITEADALAYCKERGFDWGGLYDIWNRVSCWCCPLQSLDDLRKLKRYRPELWAQLLKMEDDTKAVTPNWQFRLDYSAHELDMRFNEESA